MIRFILESVAEIAALALFSSAVACFALAV